MLIIVMVFERKHRRTRSPPSYRARRRGSSDLQRQAEGARRSTLRGKEPRPALATDLVSRGDAPASRSPGRACSRNAPPEPRIQAMAR